MTSMSNTHDDCRLRAVARRLWQRPDALAGGGPRERRPAGRPRQGGAPAARRSRGARPDAGARTPALAGRGGGAGRSHPRRRAPLAAHGAGGGKAGGAQGRPARHRQRRSAARLARAPALADADRLRRRGRHAGGFAGARRLPRPLQPVARRAAGARGHDRHHARLRRAGRVAQIDLLDEDLL